MVLKRFPECELKRVNITGKTIKILGFYLEYVKIYNKLVCISISRPRNKTLFRWELK